MHSLEIILMKKSKWHGPCNWRGFSTIQYFNDESSRHYSDKAAIKSDNLLR